MEIEPVERTNHEVLVEVPLLDEVFSLPVAVTRIETDEGIEGHDPSDYL